ncbi:MAG: hypothetical protein Q8N88_05255 [Nanoarchaeota archaeon]|nr:hypothetical protein [Nanoarchaeota archaeon]
MDLEKRREILEKIERASDEEYVTTWDSDGKIGQQKKKSEMKKGKKSKLSGNKFEVVVRKDLEEKGWVVSKWSNNVDLDEKKIISAKRKFNPFSKVMALGTGFPDFIAFQNIGENYKIIGVEVKLNGLLDKEEKEKCEFYLEKKTFNEIWIASKGENGIKYIDVKEIIERMRE